MSQDWTKRERIAMEAVANSARGRWDQSSGSIIVAGKRVAVDIVTLRTRAAKIRLRFDKVVHRLLQRLQATVGTTAPKGTTLLVTITAPIRFPAKTAAALEEKIGRLLLRGASNEKGTIHGNRVRLWAFKDKSGRTPKMIGFVHNPESDPGALLKMATELLERIGPRIRGMFDGWSSWAREIFVTCTLIATFAPN
jgi:hypothetical protein